MAPGSTPSPWVTYMWAVHWTALRSWNVTRGDELGVIALTDYEAQRADWFEELGFDTVRAIALATARDSARQLVTLHDVRKALAAGCSLEQAFEIFA